MKAVAVYPAERAVRLVDQPEPRITTPDGVLLRMLEVGICGTDREICAFDYGTPPPGADRLVIGHESLAEVIAVGPAVTRVRPGELVVSMVRRPCPHEHCAPCRGGRQDYCVTGDFVERGIKGADGFLTELVTDEERYLHVVPPVLRGVGVLVEPLTIAEKALEQVWHVQRRLPWRRPEEGERPAGEGHTAVVLGAGPVGLLGAMALRVAGFETAVYSRSPAPNDKAALVEAIGARYVSSATHSPEQLAEEVGPVDVVYEAVGASRFAFDVLRALGPNGVFVLTGVPGLGAPSGVDTDRLMRSMVLNNQVLLGTVNASFGSFEEAIRDLGEFTRRWPDAVPHLITGRFPIDAYRTLLLDTPTGIKNIVALQA